MHVIHARNVNDAYHKGLNLIADYGVKQPSRNGGVLRVLSPVTTVYGRPWERVLFDAQRNANPFFHLFEALWMLDGRDDVKTIVQFLPSFGQFSDDGETFHGAYGRRWRSWRVPRWSESDAILVDYTGLDQVTLAIQLLKRNPDDRRVMIQMWDPSRDFGVTSKDIPCNQSVNVQIVDGKLEIQVFCRSNDIVFGCYGANAVHFSMLQEYLAGMTGVPMGRYYQISSNYHAYVESPYHWDAYWPIVTPNLAAISAVNPYDARVTPASIALVTHAPTFDYELGQVMASIAMRAFHTYDPRALQNSFFVLVAQPMYIAFRAYKDGRIDDAIQILEEATQNHGHLVDWLEGGIQWLRRVLSARRARPSANEHLMHVDRESSRK